MARSSLREFQERLARRLAEAGTGERRGLLGFMCGAEHWLIELAEAGEILPPPPLSTVPLTQPWYRGLGFAPGDFPQAERYYAHAISLPMFPTLTEAQQAEVIAALGSALA